MKKLLFAIGAIAAGLILAKRFASKMGKMDWEQRFAAMPDNAPPKWMFRTISEIHDNTERIRELLEDRSEGDSKPPEAVEEGNAR